MLCRTPLSRCLVQGGGIPVRGSRARQSCPRVRDADLVSPLCPRRDSRLVAGGRFKAKTLRLQQRAGAWAAAGPSLDDTGDGEPGGTRGRWAACLMGGLSDGRPLMGAPGGARGRRHLLVAASPTSRLAKAAVGNAGRFAGSRMRRRQRGRVACLSESATRAR